MVVVLDTPLAHCFFSSETETRVIKVEGPRGPSNVQGRKVTKTGATGTPGAFAAELGRVGDDVPESAASAIEGGAGVAGVEGVLAAQTVGDRGARPTYEERKRRAKRGHELLDRLENLRRGLLAGAIPKESLAELARTMREKREAGADPQVARLMDEIELRAEVELAKLSRRLA